MTTSDRRLMTVLCSLIVLLPGEQPVSAASPARIREFNVAITPKGKGCAHHVTPASASLKKDQDALGWRIKNTCRLDQDVLLCVYREGRLSNPFHPCQKDPATRDIGKMFNVAGKHTVHLDCPAKDPGKYQKLIVVGDELSQAGCPAQIPTLAEPKLHRIGIDILP